MFQRHRNNEKSVVVVDKIDAEGAESCGGSNNNDSSIHEEGLLEVGSGHRDYPATVISGAFPLRNDDEGKVFCEPTTAHHVASFSSPPSLSCSSASCTTSDLGAVEEELKQLLKGYHQIVKKAFARALKSKESAPTNISKANTSLKPGSSGVMSSTDVTGAPVSASSSVTVTVGFCKTESAHNQQTQPSVVSLPVSSVHGDRSTDTVSVVPRKHMRRQISSTKIGLNESENTLCDAQPGPSSLAESTIANDDLFADALTEDQLNRSFEMQWKQKRGVQNFCKHFCRGVLSLQAAQNNSNGTPSWDPCPLIENDATYLAMRRAAGSPLPPFVSQDWRDFGGRSERVAAFHRPCDGRVHEPSRRRDTFPSQHEKSLSRDLNENREVTKKTVGTPQCRSNFVACDARTKQVDNTHPRKGEHTPRNVLPTLFDAKEASKSQRRRNASRYHRQMVGSTTPEIATSAKRTEEPSMRSGVTGSRTLVREHNMAARVRCNSVAGLGHTGANGGTSNYACDGEGVMYSEMTFLETAGGVVAGGVSEQWQHKQRPRRPSGSNETGVQRRLLCAATRFHAMVERRVAALEGAADHAASALPAFADSLVGAAISEFYPAVKRRQAQLKESQHAEAAAAAAAYASLARCGYRGGHAAAVSPPTTVAAPIADVRSVRIVGVHAHYPINGCLPSPRFGRD